MLRLIAGLTGAKAVKINLLRTAVWSAVALAGVLAAKFVFQPATGELIHRYADVAKLLSIAWFAAWLLIVGYVFGFGVLLRLNVRSERFKDYGTWRNLRAIPPATWWRSYRRRRKKDERDYEKTSPKRDTSVDQMFQQHFSSAGRLPPLIISGWDPATIRKKVIEYCLDLIDKTSEELNYVCCNVSPFEIWELFQKAVPQKDNLALERLKSRIVFVDAYTPVFGFADEIVLERVRELSVREHVEIVAAESAAGIHSGTAQAFKYLKAAAEKEKRNRGPCTIIYDSLSVLRVAETEQEVAEFIVHLVAAEREYDMHTIFLETSSEDRSSVIMSAMQAACGKPIEV